MTNNTLLIVGGSLAGAKAAEGARSAGFDGRVVLVGAEPEPPYERPPLSKAVLRGEAEPASTRVHPDVFYSDNSVELVMDDPVTALDLDSRRAKLASGAELDFHTVVLATGAEPRRLDIAGADLAGVHYLRTIDDSLRLNSAITSASRVAVVGAGWIGSEVAASARQVGADVVLIEPAQVPLQRVLGSDIGSVFLGLHRDHGVELRFGVGVTQLQGSSTVEGVALADGRVEPADIVVIGVGVTPRVELAGSAGLRVDDGVVVDEQLRASAPGVYAAGDVANAWHPHYARHLRVEHWANALNQGAAAGRNAAGRTEAYTRLPYFFSDQYDLGLEYVGYATADDQIAVRGSLADRQFVAFYHRNGVVGAALAVNTWDVVEDLKSLISSGAPIEPARLSDPSVPLSALVG